ncbi:MAG: carbohydrate-binding protein, partial [Duncaniella sp.]|nr:carbohydrate-binding protein [Duncaniella sp.]
SEGITTRQSQETGVYVSDIHNGDYLMVENVNFGPNSPKRFGASVASGLRGGAIEVRTDSVSGPVMARLDVPGTGGWEKWRYIETPVLAELTGVHDLYFVFTGRKGPELFNFDCWTFK